MTDQIEDLRTVLAAGAEGREAEAGCYGVYPDLVSMTARLVRWTSREPRAGLEVTVTLVSDLREWADAAWVALHPEN